ncbi:MAG: DUF1993 family protein [Henriciella sp.]
MRSEVSLFECTVPVLQHYLDQIDCVLKSLTNKSPNALEARNTPRTFSAAEHLRTAQSFALRAVFPTIGKQTPRFKCTQTNYDALMLRNIEAKAILSTVSTKDFEFAKSGLVEHKAGDAELSQSQADYVLRFAMPNFFFHLSMAYSILQMAKVPLGKNAFDGFHQYEPSFAFVGNSD